MTLEEISVQGSIKYHSVIKIEVQASDPGMEIKVPRSIFQDVMWYLECEKL